MNHRPYRVNVRFHGQSATQPGRTVAYASRERAFARGRETLAETVDRERRYAERHGRRFDPTRWDVVVFGPDEDLLTGRIIHHDGTEIDLLQASAEAAAHIRDYLLGTGWTMEDIERGEKAR